jgi:hypothetical protein
LWIFSSHDLHRLGGNKVAFVTNKLFFACACSGRGTGLSFAATLDIGTFGIGLALCWGMVFTARWIRR